MGSEIRLRWRSRHLIPLSTPVDSIPCIGAQSTT
jgi:hypothetical protein